MVLPIQKKSCDIDNSEERALEFYIRSTIEISLVFKWLSFINNKKFLDKSDSNTSKEYFRQEII